MPLDNKYNAVGAGQIMNLKVPGAVHAPRPGGPETGAVGAGGTAMDPMAGESEKVTSQGESGDTSPRPGGSEQISPA